MVLRLVRVVQRDGYATVHKHRLEWGDVRVALDVTWLGDRGRCVSYPATIGSCLAWTLVAGVHFRTIPYHDIGASFIPLESVLEMLRGGSDLARFPSNWEWRTICTHLRKNNENTAESGEDALDAALARISTALVSKQEELRERGLALPQHEGVRLHEWRANEDGADGDSTAHDA
jgi:hypothetical protein